MSTRTAIVALGRMPVNLASRALFALALVFYLVFSTLLIPLTLVQSALLFGTPFLAIFLLLVLKRFLSGLTIPRVLGPVCLYLAYLAVPTVIGLLNGNNLRYLLGDLWQVFFMLLITFIVVDLVKSSKDIDNLFRFLVLWCTLDVLFGMLRVAIFGYQRITSGSSMILVIICFHSLVRRNKTLKYPVILLTLSLIHLVFTETRTYWVGALFGMLLVLLLGDFKRLFRARCLVSVAVIAVFLAGYLAVVARTNLAGTGFNLVGIISHRMDLLMSERTRPAGSLEGRIVQAQYILDGYKQSSVLTKLLGNGFGASYSGAEREMKTYRLKEDIHHIHITYVDIIFFQGALGLSVFTTFILVTIRYGYRNQKFGSPIVDRDINRVSVILILVFLLISLAANYIWYNTFFSVLMAIIFGYRQITFKSALPGCISCV